MATISLGSNAAFSSCLDECFDMDDFLALPTDFGRQIANSESLVAEMPTVSSCADEVCSVCMEGFDDEMGVGGKRVPCGHVYHAACILTWLSHCKSCPLCRFHISSTK